MQFSKLFEVVPMRFRWSVQFQSGTEMTYAVSGYDRNSDESFRGNETVNRWLRAVFELLLVNKSKSLCRIRRSTRVISISLAVFERDKPEKP